MRMMMPARSIASRHARAVSLAAFVSLASLPFALFALGACSTSPTPPTGDRVINDTHPGPSATTPPDADSGAPPSDASTYDRHSYDVPDGYSPTNVCNQCACAASDAGFCFGGGTGQTELVGACPAPREAGAIEVGCNPFPAACADKPTCSCLIAALNGKLPCYTVCSEQGGLRVYCPNP